MSVKSGEMLSGRYELGEILGQGGMGLVRAARDLRLARGVAVKTLRPELAGRPEVRRRFEAEGRAAGRLCHHHVVAVYDVGEENGIPYIVMERVHGPGLEQEMAAGPLAPERAVEVGTGILAALGAAHAAGIVHRDVKPANVLLGADGAAKVVDFGIAKALDSSPGNADPGATAEVELTGDGQLVGTVAYMAPERVDGVPASVASDLYSVGVILYEALSGRRPFAGDTPLTMCYSVHQGRYEPLGTLVPALDPALVAVVARAMARRPEDRFATAADMAAALRAALAPAGAAPVGAPAGPARVADPATGDTTEAARPLTRLLSAPPSAATAPAGAGPGSTTRTPAWHRPLAIAGLAVAMLAGVLALGSVGGGDGGGATSAEPGVTAQPGGAPAAPGTIPEPLDDALSELEEILR